MIRFVGRAPDGLPLKRSQSQRACEPCRKRKKRCEHLENSHEVLTPPREADTNHVPGNRSPLIHVEGISNRPEANNSSRSHSANEDGGDEGDGDIPRFIGELNPEGTFLADTGSVTMHNSPEDSAGIWLQRETSDTIRSRVLHSPTKENTHRSIHSLRSLMSQVTFPQSGNECLQILPVQADFEALSKIYFEEVHPIFPILDSKMLPTLLQEMTPSRVMLKQAVCLAASTSFRAKPYLNLNINVTGSTAQTVRGFADHISQALKKVINLGIVKDKLVLMQALSILAFFTQLSDDRHAPAELCARAVSYVQTTGIHLDTSTNTNNHARFTTLYCCIWALDRLNAAFNGRPVILHERDSGRDLNTCFRQQEGCFQLFLRVILLLDEIVSLYRPTSAPSCERLESNFPTFEDLLNQSGPFQVGLPLLATIEALYHAVAMLSCRPQLSKESTRNSISFVRQSLSASSIISIVGSEYHGQLSLLPVVPHAVALSLRVFYRELREGKSQFSRTRSRRHLLSACRLLREFGETFSATIIMVDLAEQMLREMDKVVLSLQNSRQPYLHQNSPQQRDREIVLATDPQFNTNSGSGSPRQVSSRSAPVIPPVDGSYSASHQQHRTYNQDFGTLLNTGDLVSTSEWNIFDHFDPSFDLNAIDAALGNDLNPWFSIAPDDWTQ